MWLALEPNKDQLYVWHSGGFSVRRAGSRSKADKGKKQIAKGNIFELNIVPELAPIN